MTVEIDADAELTALVLDCEESETPDVLLGRALPHLCHLAAADGGLVLEARGGALVATARHGGDGLEVSSLDGHPHSGRAAAGCVVPEDWAVAGVTAVVCQPLPGLGGHLVLVWSSGHGSPPAAYDVGLALVLRTMETWDTGERLRDLQARVDNAQQLATMGDYDWHVASDTNQWSDQLYRIYGHEPQSFNASYERFLSFVHPDDRALVTEVHQRAYATGEPYQMVERILRPDGELRHLASNGQVLMGEDGAPVRFRGTCIDITDRVRAEEERERSRVLFGELVEASPDSIVVAEPDGAVVQANGRAVALLGGDPAGRTLQGGLRRGCGDEGRRARRAGRRPRRTRPGPRRALRPAGAGRRGPRPTDGLVALFLRDARERLEGEELAARLREAQVRRRQALEINDNVVQGLSAALYALEAGDAAVAAGLQRRTLATARQMMSDLLDPLDGTDLRPGDLVRSRASSVPGADDGERAGRNGTEADRAPAEQPGEVGAVGAADGTAASGSAGARVLVVDDSEDVRFLLSVQLSGMAGVEVVGEAADGEEAVRQAAELQPDLVLLDLAMPRMDGLQALPLIREAVPGVRVVVLSGFDDSVMADRAAEAGASRYVEKGTALHRLGEVIDETLALT